jgi:hypothetical protein
MCLLDQMQVAATSTTFYHYTERLNPKNYLRLILNLFKYETGDLPGDGDQEWLTIGMMYNLFKRDGGKYMLWDTG